MRLRAGFASDCGHVRPANEDSFLLRPGLYAVSDGMGGARAGEVASQMACFGLMGVDPATAGPKDLRRVIVSINKAIVSRSASEENLLGMGTTLTVALIRDGILILAHVGDSRAYLLHAGNLAQISDDHSWVGEMVRRGELTPAEAAIHPHRSVITRALGTDNDVDPDIAEMPVAEGDRVLLCSDGLTGMVADDTIAQLLQSDRDPQAVAESLVQAALAAGGEDNVTVVVVEIQADIDPATGTEAGPSWADDRILIGPSDRGAPAAATSHRARRAGAAMRERLGRLTVPPLRPVATQTTGAPAAKSAEESAGAPAEDSVAAEAPTADESATSAAATAPVIEEAAPTEAAPVVTEAPAATAAPAAAPTSAAVKAPAEASKSARLSPSQRRRRKWISWILAIVLIIAVAIAGLAWFNSTVYYVGTNDGKVALFHGLPASVLGFDFSSVVEQGTVEYVSLTPYMQERVDSHDLVSKEDGQQFLRTLGAEQ
jgi:serine/threonine protein phosphatase PrpC